MVKRLIWSELLALLIEANLDFLTCFVLSWQRPLFTEWGEVYSAVMISIVGGLCLTMLPIMTIWQIF